MHDRLIESRVQMMRGEIEQSGESRLGRGELNLLCPDELSEDHRWKTIAEIAINEGLELHLFS